MTTITNLHAKLGTAGKAQRGMTLPMTALFLVVLFAFASLAIDLGIVYTARTSAQHAADAAALAGAYSFIDDAMAADPVATAGAHAIAIAAKNSVLGQPVAIPAASVQPSPCPAATSTSWVCVDTANRRVTVNVARAGPNGIATYFARVVGWNLLDIASIATAEAAKTTAGASCIQPIFVPNTVLSKLTKLKDACDQGQRLFDASGNITAFALANVNTLVNFRPLDPHNAQAPSQYYTVDYGNGANTVRCTIAHCLNDPACGVDANILTNFTVSCGTTVMTENGNQTGPVVQGMTELIVGDTYNPQTGLIDNGSKDSSPQMTLAPVWDDCVAPWYTKGNISPGKQPVKVIGFAKVFVNGPPPGPQGQVDVTFVQPIPCAGVSPNPGTGPFAQPVRIIQRTD